jgi:large repetitive protein
MLLGSGVFTLAAVPAAADPNPSIDSSPTAATTATLLEWGFSNASPASCELSAGGATVVALADCSSPADFDVAADAGGSYTFTVYAAAAADVVVGTTASATSTVDVAPVAPAITASPTTPDNDPTPAWSFTLPTAATATCELDDPSSNAVDTVANCTSPFTSSDLNGAPANGGNGKYTLSVTPTAGGVTGAAATSSYTFDTVQPDAPNVSADAVTGFALHPTFTVDGLVAGATLSCTVTSPGGGPAVAVQTCGTSSVLDLSGGIDGSYALQVTQTKDGNVSTAGTATYLLDTHTPATPTVTAPTSPGADASPTFVVSGVEAGAIVVCAVTGPSPVPVTACGAATTLDLSSASDGTYTLTVNARDAAGKDSAPATATYEFEGGGPAAPMVTGPSSPSNVRAPTFGVTDSDPVALTYACSVTGPSTVTTSQCGPSTSLALTGAADGTYVLSVVAIDGLNQSSPAGTATYTLDTAAPPTPTVTPPTSPSSDSSPTFTISEAEAGTTLTCTINGPTTFPIPAASCASGLTLDLSGANRDGVYTLSVTATDTAGNVSSVGTATYTLDTTPPPAPAIVAPVSPSKDLTPTFAITDSEAGVALGCAFLDPSAAVVFSGTCPVNGTFDTSTDGTDGTYHLIVTATDAAGNPATSSAAWTRDTAAPPIPTLSAPLSPSNDVTPTFTIGDAEAGVSFTCVLTGPGAVIRFTGACPINGIFDLTGFGDGAYSLKVTATDAAGNTSAPRTRFYTLDTTPPPRPVVTLSAPLLSLSNVTLPQFTVSDGQPGVTFNCSVSGVTPVPASAITCGATTTVDLSGLGRDGNYTLSVTATEAAGNTSAAGTATYTLDATPPPGPIVTAPPSPSNDLTPTFTINDTEAGVVLGCVLTGPGSTIAFANLCPANATFDVTGFGDGMYALTVTATDLAGNVAPTTGTATYLLDTTPPPVPAVALSVPSASPGNLASPAFAVSDAETGVAYSCTVTGPTLVPPSAVNCGATTTIDLSGAGRDGRYKLAVTATDAAGNTSAAGSAFYKLDTAPPPSPSVTLSSPASSPGHLNVPQFSLTDSEVGVNFTCSVSGVTPVPPSAITCGPTTSVDLSGAGRDGSYTLSVTATDAAGNISSATSAVYVLDTIAPPAPAVTLTLPGSSPGKVMSPQFSVSDTEAGVTYNCTVSGPTGVPASAIACGSTTAVDLTGAGRDGSYTLSVAAVDAAGNVSAVGTATYTLDTNPPPVPAVVLSSPSSSPSNVTGPVFSVTDTEAGVSYSCSVTGPTAVPSSAIACGPATAIDLSGPGRDGTYRLSVTATDSAGNVSAAGKATYVLDTTPPPTPSVTLAVPSSSPGNVTAPQFTVSDTEAGVSYFCSVTGATTVPGSAVTCGAATTVDLSGTSRDGSYTLSVTATDAAGNVSAAGAATYMLDSTPPPAPVVISPGASTKLPTFGITDGDPSAVLTCLLTSPKGRTVFPTTPPATCPTPTTFDTTAFADGTYTLVVTATDAAGNSTSTTTTWLRDTTAPAVPSVALTVPSSSPGNVATPQFAVSDTEAGVTYACVVAGASTVPSSAVGCGATTTVDLTGGGRDGLYTLSVTATDAAGNTSAAGSATYVLDTAAPPMPLVTLSAPASSPGNVTAPQFAVTDTEVGVAYTCSVAGATNVPSSAVACGATTTVGLSGANRDGLYTLSVTATDAAGNSSAVGSATYTLDTAAPPTPSVALNLPSSSPGRLTTPQFVVIDTEPGVRYTCSVTGATAVPSSGINCGPITTFPLPASGGDGAYTLSVTATDAAGNTSAAGSATYTLDTTPPAKPIVGLASATRSNSKTPVWTWQFAFNDPATSLDVATCTVMGPNAWTSTTVNCAHNFTTLLGGVDGPYILTVTLTDEAGNTSSATSPIYTLDSTAPAGPVVTLRRPVGGVGLDRHPLWTVSGPSNSTFMCTLRRGGDLGTIISPEAVCPSPATYSLVGQPDGLFTLQVVAVDAAHNTSFPAWSSYALVPSAPLVESPQRDSATAVWAIDGNPRDTYICTLTGNGAGVVSGPRTCDAHPTYDMSPLAPGEYTLSVVQVGAEGVRSEPGTATWHWDGVSSHVPGPPPAVRHPHHPGGVTKQPTGSGPTPSPPGIVKRTLHRIGHGITKIPFIHPIVHPGRVTQDVVGAVQGVVGAVGSAGGGTGFPLLLIGLVMIFLLVQNRIDRRDPKLALASIAADDTVDFHPPPSRKDRP